jgi:arsenate reductase
VSDSQRAAPFRILVLCTGNSARSQIAEALLATMGAERIEAVSAGSRPAPQVNPMAIEVLREHGIAWEGRTPKGIDAVADQRFDLVITVCDNARDVCPVFPGARVQVHWGMPDPAEVHGDEERRLAFRDAYERLARWVEALLALPLEAMDATALRSQSREIVSG